MELTKQKHLCFEAMRWVGVTEKGGNNKGEVISMFQKTVDKVASAEPWCLCFAMYCIVMVDRACVYFYDDLDYSKIFKTEHCLTAWRKTSDELKTQESEPGTIVLWRKKGSTSGHAGIVIEVHDDGTFTTVEGNTSSTVTGSQREGDGVFMKRRSKSFGNFEILGFIKPWG